MSQETETRIGKPHDGGISSISTYYAVRISKTNVRYPPISERYMRTMVQMNELGETECEKEIVFETNR
ncbi:MAG: hypothetical protein AB1798_16350 [Spirochaetota bacterium]